MKKAALITGSTSGIGWGIAQELAASGYDIMLNGIAQTEEFERLLEELSSYPVEVHYHAADLSRPEDIGMLIASTLERFPHLDVLVNNAGIQHVAPVESFPAEKWEYIIRLNLNSAFHTSRLVIPHFKAKNKGRIVNIASVHGLVASPYKSAYVAAKHGILGLTKTLGLELAQTPITCNAICPGYVQTPLVELQLKDTAEARGMSVEEVKQEVILKAQPTRRFTRVEDIGQAVLFLCSDAASNMTGSTLTLDGGWSAQ